MPLLPDTYTFQFAVYFPLKPFISQHYVRFSGFAIDMDAHSNSALTTIQKAVESSLKP